MDFWIMLVLALPQASMPQQQVEQPVTTATTGTALEPTTELQQERPLAAPRGTVVRSKNEAYNAARLAEGRLGIRLGNDASYRVTGN